MKSMSLKFKAVQRKSLSLYLHSFRLSWFRFTENHQYQINHQSTNGFLNNEISF